ncbi:MAG: hypothetical protein C5B49_08550 [Bdellovibrio sp.]|nr:MAG: hypothetical protein C5B49_08550 [Bdellovibrio sp.]
MIQAKHIMKRSTPILSYSATVPEAIEYMRNHQEGFAIVQASPNRFQGVLTEAQLMRIFLRYQTKPDRDTVILHRDLFEPAQLTHEDENFPEIVKKLVSAVGSRLFVINAQGAVVGHVTAKDVLPYFSSKGPAPADAQPMENLRSDLYLYETFFSKSPFMMHSANREGRIIMANEMLHSVLGYEYGQLLGKTIFEIYPKSSHAQASAGLKTIFTQGYHKVVQGEMLTKEGRAIGVELVSRSLSNQFQAVIGTMTVSRPLDMKLLLESLPVLSTESMM